MTLEEEEKIHAMKGNKNKYDYLQVVTMIEPATDWILIWSMPETIADLVANQEEQGRLSIYPLLNKIIVDRGIVFLAEFKTMMLNDYGISYKSISSRNPQANAIVRRVH